MEVNGLTYEVIDLFCGVGGLAYGFAEAGYIVTGYDIDERAVCSFSSNVGRAFRLDLLKSPLPKIPDAFIMLGGPPCEPWSALNLYKRGREHPLYGCIFRFLNFVYRRRPVLFILENVPLAFKDQAVINSLRKLYGIYSTNIRVINYADYGAAISRRRAFAVGVRRDIRLDAATIFDSIPREKAKTVHDVIYDLRGRDWDPSFDHVWPKVSTVNKYRTYYRSGKYGWYVTSWDRPCPSFGNITKTYILHPDSFNGGPTRPLSVREALRIMGFPDHFRFPPGIPMRAKYEMIGDAVTPVFSAKVASVVKLLL
jgi:DNA (cytosine-5)-methyltransferase 1